MDKVEALLAKGSRPGPGPLAKKFGLPEASVRYPFYPALFPRVARGSDPAPDPDPVSLPIISHRRGRECGGCHIRHAVDSRRARRPRRRGRGAPALRDGRRRSTVSARYTAHRGGERGPPHEREVARGVRAMRSRPTAAELELSVRASPAERRRADAGGEARGRRARGSVLRAAPTRTEARPERVTPRSRPPPPAATRTSSSVFSKPAPTSTASRSGPAAPPSSPPPSDSAEARRCCEMNENRRRRQLCLRGGGWATPGLRRRPRRRRAHGLRHGPSRPPARIRTGARETRTPRMSSRDEPPPRAPSGAPTRPSEDSTTRHSTSPSPPTSTRRRNDASRRTPRAGASAGGGGHRRRPGRGRATRHRGCQGGSRKRRRPRRVRRGFHAVTHGGVGRSRGRRRSTHEKRRGRQRARAERIHHAVGSRREVRRRHHPRFPLRGRRRRGTRRV